MAQGKPFEIIFASSDRDDASFKEYFGTMPWLALPLNDPRKAKLSDLCDVEGESVEHANNVYLRQTEGG